MTKKTIVEKIIEDLDALANPSKAKILSGFFKTGKGQYGEGDIFLGVTVPQQRLLVRKYYPEAFVSDAIQLLKSKVHEQRLTGILILVAKYKKAQKQEKKEIFDSYLQYKDRVNNWDLVDLSAPNIVGDYLLDRQGDRQLLYKLATSKNLWHRRIAIISTLTFIREGQYKDTIKLSAILLKDQHDLIHKAVGWMLREMGKRDPKLLESFLDENKQNMPRTMLRYAIERLSPEKRVFYLKK